MEILRLAGTVSVVCFLALSSVAQETRRVEGIKGEWIISNDITPAQARAKAIEQAKVDALRKAGVTESVAESNILYTSEKESKLKDRLESVISVDMAGELSGFEITKEEKKINEFGNLVYEVWINAEIIFHNTSGDPGFNVAVGGIHDSYGSPEDLTFEMKPSGEGFLNVFILGDDESLHLFPNKYEKREKFEGGITYKFPRSKALDYEVSSEQDIEVNYLILLYTKSEVPFLEEQTTDNILHFIARIDPSQKCIRSYPILISKK